VSLLRRGGGVPPEMLSRASLPRGEKVLAHAVSTDGTWLLGTRARLVLLLPDQVAELPWEQIEDAAWNMDERHLRITGVGTYGEPRPSYSFDMEDPALLLQLLRERVTASIVLQRRVPVIGSLGLTVIGRRSPVGGPVAWMHAYDPGLDPNDPDVSTAADQALADAQSEVGELPA
jgi:hypothetical protein